MPQESNPSHKKIQDLLNELCQDLSTLDDYTSPDGLGVLENAQILMGDLENELEYSGII